MDELLDALKSDFAGKNEILRQTILNKTPKYGEDDDYSDLIAKDLVDQVVSMIESYPPSPIRRASKRAYFLPTTAHVYFGKVTGATPDGRKAGFPVSEGISPVQGSGQKASLRFLGRFQNVTGIKLAGPITKVKSRFAGGRRNVKTRSSDQDIFMMAAIMCSLMS